MRTQYAALLLLLVSAGYARASLSAGPPEPDLAPPAPANGSGNTR